VSERVLVRYCRKNMFLASNLGTLELSMCGIRRSATAIQRAAAAAAAATATAHQQNQTQSTAQSKATGQPHHSRVTAAGPSGNLKSESESDSKVTKSHAFMSVTVTPPRPSARRSSAMSAVEQMGVLPSYQLARLSIAETVSERNPPPCNIGNNNVITVHDFASVAEVSASGTSCITVPDIIDSTASRHTASHSPDHSDTVPW
jgi:hypothetical protein